MFNADYLFISQLVIIKYMMVMIFVINYIANICLHPDDLFPSCLCSYLDILLKGIQGENSFHQCVWDLVDVVIDDKRHWIPVNETTVLIWFVVKQYSTFLCFEHRYLQYHRCVEVYLWCRPFLLHKWFKGNLVCWTQKSWISGLK